MRLPSIALAVAATTAAALSIPIAAQAAPLTHPPAHLLTTSPTVESEHCTVLSPADGDKKVTRCFRLERIPLRDLSAAQQAERKRSMARLVASAAGVTPPTQCDFGLLTGVNPTPDRFTSCNDVVQVLTELENGTPVGAFEFEDQSWVSFSVSSLQWFHGLSEFGLVAGAFGTLADGAAGVLTNDCNSVVPPLAKFCNATPAIDTTTAGPETVFLSPGASHLFAWNETDTGAASTGTGNVDILDTFIGQDWDFSAEKLNNTNENLPGTCDSLQATINRGSPGCVDEDFFPTLVLSQSVYGASAAMIQWAQNNLLSQWGLQTGPQMGDGNPLQRMYNPTLTQKNRSIICDSTFVNLGTFIGGPNDKDSCDEYPFAGTYDSGATQTPLSPAVTSGSQCVQLAAVQTATSGTEAQQWNNVKVGGSGTFNNSAACVRGHIPNLLNQAVGSAYAALITTNRLIDTDYFYVSVTP